MQTLNIPKQAGSVLFVGLIMLILITLVTLTAMNGNNIQTIMTGNALTEINSLGDVESELPKLEAALNTAILSGAVTSVCSNPPGAQDAALDPAPANPSSLQTANQNAFRTLYGYANKPADINYVITCTNRKSIQQTLWNSVTNSYVITPSSTCLDYYNIEVTDSSGKGTRRVVESKFSVTPVPC